jgi:hypothetical protein
VSYGPRMVSPPDPPTQTQRTPWGPRGLICLGWTLSFFVALAFRSTTLMRKGGRPSWSERLVEDHWLAFVLTATATSLVAAVVLLRRGAPSPRPPAPLGWGGAFVRGVVFCALLSGALALYLVLGGHDILYYYPWTPVGTAALLAPLLGLISVLEGRPAERLRAQIGWALLIGLLAFVAMLTAWIQREYVNELFVRGFSPAFEKGLAQVKSLGSNPPWTVAHYGWIAVPVACSAFTRLRSRGDRVWLALALTGVIAPWWVRFVPAGDAVIATTSVLICVLTPLAWSLGDRARDALAVLLFER